MADATTDGRRDSGARAVAPLAPGSLSAANISIHVGGDNQGAILVGDNNIVRQTIHGAVLVTNPEAVAIRLRSAPFIRPRPISGFLGRTDEIRTADDAVASFAAVNFHGGDGWGKSALLRHLAHRFDQRMGLQGIVYDVAAGHGVDDILQFLFDAFYVASADPAGRTTVNFKPMPGQLAHLIQPLRALIVLDDVELSRDAAESLTDAAPGCAFLMASRERVLVAAGAAFQLRGLAPDDSLRLLEQELGRSLTDRELPTARRNCGAVQGQPSAIIQIAAVIRDLDYENVASVTAGLRAADERVPERQLVASLRRRARSVLALLALLAGSPLRPDDAAAITGEVDAAADIEQLEALGLAQAAEGGFVVNSSSPAALRDELEAGRWSSRVVDHYVGWAERHAESHPRLLQAWRTLLTVLLLAAAAGRWSAVWRLVRVVEPALVLSARWGSWELVLLRGLDATRRLADPHGEAWCLHQLGVRALSLGHVGIASDWLERALEIRRSVGDRSAAAATRRNLARIRIGRPGWHIAVAVGAALSMLAGGMVAGFATARSPSPIRLPFGTSAGTTAIPATPSPMSASGHPATSHPATSHPALAAMVVVNPAALDLGSQFLGESARPKVLTVKNQGTADAIITEIRTSGEFAAVQQTCSAPKLALKAGHSCTVDVQFQPKSAGKKTGQLTITDRGGENNVTLIGLGQPPLRFSVDYLDFGQLAVGSTSPTKNASLINLSSVPQVYTVSGVKGPFLLDSPCIGVPYSLSPRVDCLTTVNFHPDTTGVSKGSFTVVDAFGDVYVLSLSGVGVVPLPLFTPPSLDFGIVATEAKMSVVLTNSGPADLVVEKGGVSISTQTKPGASDGFSIASDGCSGTTVSARGCTVEVEFNPTGPGGSFEGRLTFKDNAPGGSQTVGLKAYFGIP